MTALTARDRKGLCPQEQHKQREKFISIHTCLAKKRKCHWVTREKQNASKEKDQRGESRKKEEGWAVFSTSGYLAKSYLFPWWWSAAQVLRFGEQKLAKTHMHIYVHTHTQTPFASISPLSIKFVRPPSIMSPTVALCGPFTQPVDTSLAGIC